MKIFLQLGKIVLTTLLATLGVFLLYMLFGSAGHPHSMGLEKLFTATGLGMGSGVVAATVTTIVTIKRYNRATLRSLKILDLLLLLANTALFIGILLTWR